MTPRTPPPMTEGQLLEAIRGLAQVTGWLCYHTHDSRHSEPGFPDLVLLSAAQGRLIIAELKDATRKATPEQNKWLSALTHIGIENTLWRPQHLRDRTIEHVLKGRLLIGPVREPTYLPTDKALDYLAARTEQHPAKATA